MAMVHQRTEGGPANPNTTEEESHVSEGSEGTSSRPSSQCSGGSKRSTPGIMPQYQYSKEVLVELSKNPLSQKRPVCLNSSHNNSTGKWDPERWFVNKRGDKPPVEEPRPKRERQDIDISISHKRRTSDPKERIKEEKDEIVLSPQRRSFGTGCHVIQHSSLAKRPGSPTDGREVDNFREPTRRIGSGRIMNRERDQREWEREHRDFSYNGVRNDRRDRFDQDDGEKDIRRYSNRYGRGDRRMRGNDRIEEEPEWFSGGPTSQSETIELVGFDDASNAEDSRKTNKKGSNKKSREVSRKQSLKSEEDRTESKPVVNQAEEHDTQKDSQSQVESKVKVNSKPSSPELISSDVPEDSKSANVNFDLDELFRMDWIPGLIPNETPPDQSSNEITCSRFSQWFQRESPVLGLQESCDNSRRSSLQDELIAHVLSGIGEPQLIPSPTHSGSENYFAPISPALTHSPNCSIPPPRPANCTGSKNIMEMLQSANKSSNDNVINGEKMKILHENDVPENAKSVKELEAGLKRIVLGDNQMNQAQSQDRSAFDKLVRQMSSATPSISMGPLDKSKALQEEEFLQNILGPSSIEQSQTPRNEKPVPSVAQHASGLIRPPYAQQTSQLPETDLYTQIYQHQRRQHVQQQIQAQQQRQVQQAHQQQQQHLQQAQHPPSQAPKQPINVQGGFTVDMLAKILETQTQPPLSPVTSGLHQSGSMPFNRSEQQSLNALLHQQQRQRELLSTMLKQQQQQPTQPIHTQAPMMHQQRCTSSKEIAPGTVPQTLGLPILAPGASPRQSPLPPEAISSTMPTQGRIPSPLVFGQQPPALSHAPAPIHPNNLAQAIAQNATAAATNTLQVQNAMVLQRVPSPQELAVHTQSILQNALIKRKLEEQKENFRKRQEAQRTNSPGVPCAKNGSSSSPLKGLSPTIAFTPTSVMRKMHTEKTDNPQQKIDGLMQNGGNKVLNSLDNRSSELDQNMFKLNNAMIHLPGTDNIFSSRIQSDVSPHHSNNGNVIGPRPLYGQSLMTQPRPQHLINSSAMNSAPSIVIPGQGRPIVKGGNGQTSINPGGELARVAAGINKTGIPNKHFVSGNNQYSSVHTGSERDLTVDTLNKLMEQQRIHQQHQKSLALLGQRRQSTSPMPPMHTAAAAAFTFGPRGPANVPHNPSLVRPMNLGPANVAAPNLNFPLLRTMIQSNPAMRAQTCSLNPLTTLGQLAALQQIQRGVTENRQIQAAARNYPPMALQQLLLNTQNQVAAAQAQVAAGFVGGHGDGKHQHLLPGATSVNRQSPVNLTKWFGNDVLKQKMPDMPPVSHQKALLLEDVERQQQHSTVVHN